jgi:hypothetical protein
VALHVQAALAKARGPATRASLTGQGTGEGEEQENTEDMDEENNENDPSNGTPSEALPCPSS